MYPNLRAEMKRKGITLAWLAEQLGITIGTLSQKLTGKSPFTLNEAKKIKEILELDIPIEILFEVGV